MEHYFIDTRAASWYALNCALRFCVSSPLAPSQLLNLFADRGTCYVWNAKNCGEIALFFNDLWDVAFPESYSDRVVSFHRAEVLQQCNQSVKRLKLLRYWERVVHLIFDIKWLDYIRYPAYCSQKVIFIIISRLCLSLQRVSSGITEALKESRKGADGEQLKTLVKGTEFCYILSCHVSKKKHVGSYYSLQSKHTYKLNVAIWQWSSDFRVWEKWIPEKLCRLRFWWGNDQHYNVSAV